jgi:hypothetical protein
MFGEIAAKSARDRLLIAPQGSTLKARAMAFRHCIKLLRQNHY